MRRNILNVFEKNWFLHTTLKHFRSSKILCREFILLNLILFSSCAVLESEHKIVSIEVSQIFPDINDSGKVIKYDTALVRIYQKKNMQIFVLPYLFEQWNEDTLTYFEERYHYLFHEGEDTYGYDLDRGRGPETCRRTFNH